MIKLYGTLGMPIKVSNHSAGTHCQWHLSSSKVTSVKLAAWDQNFGHSGVEYHKLYVFPPPKSLLNFSQPTPTCPFIFENYHGFILPSHFKAEQLHFRHISFSEGLQTNTEADNSSSSITYLRGIFQAMSVKPPGGKGIFVTCTQNLMICRGL